MRKAKIIATIGPASEKPKVLESLIRAGVDVCRLNFSFGTHEEHLKKIKLIRETAAKVGKAVAILQDLQGPKIRMGKLKGPVKVKKGDLIVLSGKTEHKSEFYLPTTYPMIASDTQPGKTILIADGKIVVKVVEAFPAKKEVHCKVVAGGEILTGKGINLPYTNISLPALTPKDREDAVFGAQAGVDYMGLSFVRQAKDVLALRKLLDAQGVKTPIIAKIEKPEALDHLEAILDVVDGVMVARGDLADEISFACVPVAQKRILHAANRKGKITIIATEMLGSMVDEPLPSRAEVSDVANGVWDHSDCVMLSNESATGKYPLQAVKAMASIVEHAEDALVQRSAPGPFDLPEQSTLTKAVCAAASDLSRALKARAIVVLTHTGETAEVMSKFRPAHPIFGMTFDIGVYQRMAFLHNVHPVLVERGPDFRPGDFENESELVQKALLEANLVKKGDQLILVARAIDDHGKRNVDTLGVMTVA